MPLTPEQRGLLSTLTHDYADLALELLESSLQIVKRAAPYAEYKTEDLYKVQLRRIAIEWMAVDWTKLGTRTEEKGNTAMVLLAQVCLAFPEDLEELAPALARRLTPLRSWLLNVRNPVNQSDVISADMPAGWPSNARVVLAKVAHVWNRNYQLRQRMINRVNGILAQAVPSRSTVAEWRDKGLLNKKSSVTVFNLKRVRQHNLDQGWEYVPNVLDLQPIVPTTVSPSSEWANIDSGYRAGVWFAPNYVIFDLSRMIEDVLTLQEITPYVNTTLATLPPEVRSAGNNPLDAAVNYFTPALRNFLLGYATEPDLKVRQGIARHLEKEYPTNWVDLNMVRFDTERCLIMRRNQYDDVVRTALAKLRPKELGTKKYVSKSRQLRTIALSMDLPGIRRDGFDTISIAFRGEALIGLDALVGIDLDNLRKINGRISLYAGKVYTNLSSLRKYADSYSFSTLADAVETIDAALKAKNMTTLVGWNAAYAAQERIDRVNKGEKVRGVPPFRMDTDLLIFENWKHYMHKDAYEELRKFMPQYTDRHIRLRGRFLVAAHKRGLTLQDLRDPAKVKAAFGSDLHKHRHVLACV